MYSPLGLGMRWTGQQGWSVHVSGEYDLFWFGVQKSHLSDASAGFNDIENDQDDGYGLRGSIGVEKKGQDFDWLFETFVRYWDIDQSDSAPVTFGGTLIGSGFEPANETIEVGGAITIRF